MSVLVLLNTQSLLTQYFFSNFRVFSAIAISNDAFLQARRILKWCERWIGVIMLKNNTRYILCHLLIHVFR